MGHEIMRRSRLRAALTTASTVVALGIAPASLSAQTYWRVPGALGGALVGAGAGWAVDLARAAGDSEFSGVSLIGTPIGLAAGGVLGFMGGLGADRRLARGDTLTLRARATLRLAMFLTPVAIGSATAFAIINPSEEACAPSFNPGDVCTPPRKIASDETVVLLGIGGGVLLGFVAQHRFARALWPKGRVGLAPSSRGVSLSITASW